MSFDSTLTLIGAAGAGEEDAAFVYDVVYNSDVSNLSINSVKPDSQGNIIGLGVFRGHTYDELYVVKLSPVGEKIWDVLIAASGVNLGGNSVARTEKAIAIDSSDNIYVTGTPAGGYTTIYKISADGVVQTDASSIYNYTSYTNSISANGNDEIGVTHNKSSYQSVIRIDGDLDPNTQVRAGAFRGQGNSQYGISDWVDNNTLQFVTTSYSSPYMRLNQYNFSSSTYSFGETCVSWDNSVPNPTYAPYSDYPTSVAPVAWGPSYQTSYGGYSNNSGNTCTCYLYTARYNMKAVYGGVIYHPSYYLNPYWAEWAATGYSSTGNIFTAQFGQPTGGQAAVIRHARTFINGAIALSPTVSGSTNGRAVAVSTRWIAPFDGTGSWVYIAYARETAAQGFTIIKLPILFQTSAGTHDVDGVWGPITITEITGLVAENMPPDVFQTQFSSGTTAYTAQSATAQTATVPTLTETITEIG
jgi:hypothetical protein